MSGRALSLLVLTVALAGCGGRQIGHFGEGAFYHVQDHYRIRYEEPDDPRLMPARWVLENFHHDTDGHPTNARDDERFFAWYQAQGRDGARGRAVRLPRVDLLFRRPRSPAHVWIRTVPLDDAWASRPLSRLIFDALRAYTSGRRGPDLLGRPTTVLDAALAMRLVDRGPAIVDGRSAWTATFDLGAHPSSAHDPDGAAMRERITLVVVDSGTATVIGGRAFPLLIVAGCSSPPGEHEARRAELGELVSRLDFARAP